MTTYKVISSINLTEFNRELLDANQAGWELEGELQLQSNFTHDQIIRRDYTTTVYTQMLKMENN